MCSSQQKCLNHQSYAKLNEKQILKLHASRVKLAMMLFCIGKESDKYLHTLGI